MRVSDKSGADVRGFIKKLEDSYDDTVCVTSGRSLFLLRTQFSHLGKNKLGWGTLWGPIQLWVDLILGVGNAKKGGHRAVGDAGRGEEMAESRAQVSLLVPHS